MSIQPVNSAASRIPFKGQIKAIDSSGELVYELDTDKILDISTRKDNKDCTLIKYDIPKVVKHNGYQWNEPSVLMVQHDMDTILKAYSAAKNSNVCIDITECNH